jgi:hypothetical protein
LYPEANLLFTVGPRSVGACTVQVLPPVSNKMDIFSENLRENPKMEIRAGRLLHYSDVSDLDRCYEVSWERPVLSCKDLPDV